MDSSDASKIFVGGISWETSDEKLREYFESYGQVVEAVIMKDRATGRGRGFGFVVFAEPDVADRVVQDKHHISGKLVEAKKAVPKDEHQNPSRANSSISNAGSTPPPPPLPPAAAAASLSARTKKIFVGGLAPTVTEDDFRQYFEQFGNITDVVVMYDHATNRPRGFGFITYDSEEAVDNVLQKTFHELKDKMVEVKRAVPKDASAYPSAYSSAATRSSPQAASRPFPAYGQAFAASPYAYGPRYPSYTGYGAGYGYGYAGYAGGGYAANPAYGSSAAAGYASSSGGTYGPANAGPVTRGSWSASYGAASSPGSNGGGGYGTGWAPAQGGAAVPSYGSYGYTGDGYGAAPYGSRAAGGAAGYGGQYGGGGSYSAYGDGSGYGYADTGSWRAGDGYGCNLQGGGGAAPHGGSSPAGEAASPAAPGGAYVAYGSAAAAAAAAAAAGGSSSSSGRQSQRGDVFVE